MLAIEHER